MGGGRATITIDRRVGTLYADERADMILYLNGEPPEMNRLWAALRDERSWDFFIGADGRIVLKPLGPKEGRAAVSFGRVDPLKASRGGDERWSAM